MATREQFAAFLDRLRDDLKARSESWENVTLDSFLEAFAAITRDSPNWRIDGLETDVETASWRLFARLLATASIYE